MIMLFSIYLFFKLYFIFGCKDIPCEHDLECLKFLLLLHKSNLKHLTYHSWMLFSDWKVSGVFRISCWHDVSENKLFKVQPTWARCATGQCIIILVLDFWEAKVLTYPTLPQPNVNINFSFKAKSWVMGGVGWLCPRYFTDPLLILLYILLSWLSKLKRCLCCKWLPKRTRVDQLAWFAFPATFPTKGIFFRPM